MQTEPAYLILTQNGEQMQVFSFTGDSIITIGRATENFVSFIDDRCSRFHAKLFFNAGQWFLQDLGSRNGTFVDDLNIATRASMIRAGQRIQIGHTVLQFGTGLPGELDTKASVVDGDCIVLKRHSGVIGVSETLQGPVKEGERELESEIIHQKSYTTLLKADSEEATQNVVLPTTKTGFGPAEMCRLAYQIGKAENIEHVARMALEGLLAATNAEGAGLWLFPYSLHSQQQASDIRLVAETTLNKAQYSPISAALARTVFDKQEAFLVHENSNEGTTKRTKKTTVVNGSEIIGVNNTLVAPIRYQSGSILGMLHLYTASDERYLDESDLEYALAIADTVGIALANINRQKELATNLTQARKENLNLREMLQMNSEIIGNSPAIQMVHHLIARAAEGKTALLIRGESGTGKELIARAVHLASPRKTKPFVCLNCAAVSETLLESELYGHEKGAFTGATERKLGKFEAADMGTLFLDEIGEMTPSLQAKMLRVLENSAFERVGGNVTINVDVRIITATNRDLEKEVAAGRFRHDLFFRLRVLEIIVPPLRKRPTDIAILAKYFLERFCKETGRKYTGFDPGAMDTLMRYRWPGNVRELKNIIERAVVLGSEPMVLTQDLLLSQLSTTGESQVITPERQEQPQQRDLFIPLTLDDVERNHIIRTLQHTEWNKSLASKQLGIERTTLDRKIKRYNIEG